MPTSELHNSQSTTPPAAPSDHPFSADRPIESKADDLLGRAAFADHLAQAIEGWRQKDSLILALYGPWGTGKSSIKNMVREALAAGATESSWIVEYNPWQWAGQDQLAEGFFAEVAAALGRGDKMGTGKKRAQAWRAYAAYLRVGRVVVGGSRRVWGALVALLGLVGLASSTKSLGLAMAGLIVFLAGAALAWGEDLALAIAGVMTARAELGRKSLQEVKDELTALMATADRPLVVILDDIDRLAPDQIRLLFQLVKANADFPNLVYLLLCQRDIVERSLTDPAISGKQFLEKIVQVGFDVPLIERSRLEKVLFAGLDALLQKEGVDTRFTQRRWGNVYFGGLRPYFDSLRDVRRFLGTLSFSVSLLSAGRSFEVNPIDLIAVETLRVFEPQVYAALALSKDVFTKARDQFTSQDQVRQAIDAVIDRASEETRPHVREIIKQLFPPIEWTLGGSGYGAEFSEGWFRDLRVCHPDVFDRYFLLAIREDDLSQQELDRILELAGDRSSLASYLRDLHRRGLLLVALDRLEAYKQTVDIAHAKAFVTAFFDIGDLLPSERGGMFGMSSDMHAVRIVLWYLKQDPDPVHRAATLKECIQETSGVYLPVMETSLEARREEAGGRRSEEDYLVPEGELPKLQTLCVNKIHAAASDGSLAHHPHLAYILYRWREWESDKEPREWISVLIQTAEGLGAFLTAFAQQVTSYGIGDHVAQSQWAVRLSDLENFVVIDELTERIDACEPTALPTEAVQAFRRALKRREEGKSEDVWRLEE